MKKTPKSVISDLVHLPDQRSNFLETSQEISLTSGFIYKKAEHAEQIFLKTREGYQYTRLSNPTTTSLEHRFALLDGFQSSLVVSSGMAAVFAALMVNLESGDHVVASRSLFGSCYFTLTNLLPKYGIEYSLIDGTDLDAWRLSIKKNTKVFFFETVSNPTLEIIDLKRISALAKKNKIVTIADNILPGPYTLPLAQYGIDYAVYSGTKHIDGQGRVIGGIINSSKKNRKDKLEPFVQNAGLSISPFNSWVLIKGLETLPLRVDKASTNALKIANFLNKHKKVYSVHFPFLNNHPEYSLAKKQMKNGGTVLSFAIKGNKKTAFKFLNSLKMIKLSNNFGDTKSMAIHPATTTHLKIPKDLREKIGIHDNLIRVSIGIEETADLINDLNLAFAKL